MPRQKYEQIYSILKGQIEAGDYPVGGLLPSENVLIGEFQCSRNTVRRALANLVRDGYVQTRQGWGVCNIYQPIETSAYTMGTIESFAETARRTGQNSLLGLGTGHGRPCPAAPAFPRAPNSSISSGSTIWTACHASSTTTTSAGTACPA